MIISHQHRFIFVKTRKTAGTSIEVLLEKLAGDDAVVTQLYPSEPGHRPRNWQGLYNPLPDVKAEVAAGGVTGTLRGAGSLVRNIRRRHAYWPHMPAEIIRARVGARVWDDYFTFCFERDPLDKTISRYRWRTSKLAEPMPFEQWALVEELPTDWSRYTIDGRVAVDFVGRFESLEADLATALAHIGVEREVALPHAKQLKSTAKPDVEITPAVERRVAEVFANEIRTFGYRGPGER